MTHFWAIYVGRLLGNSMKSMSFPISDAWLVKVVTCVIIPNVTSKPQRGGMCIAIAASQPQFLMSLRLSTLGPKKYLFLILDKWPSLRLTEVPLHPREILL